MAEHGNHRDVSSCARHRRRLGTKMSERISLTASEIEELRLAIRWWHQQCLKDDGDFRLERVNEKLRRGLQRAQDKR